MSDEEAPAAAAEAAHAKPKAAGGTSKAVMALLVLNLAASGFGVFKIMTTKHTAEAAPVKKEEPEHTLEVTGPIVSYDPFVVNLDEPGTARYLKVTIQLELADHKAEETFEKSKQPIRDAILSHLSGLHIKDTLGATAKEGIRTDLAAKIEKVVGPGKMKRLFFSEFVLQ